ncbi:MAG: DUF2849 domain-containing protein [Hyphomonadaceae bacterium]|nr:DUF2849 domain-containing protein [Hyphomonadaceae bacterium]
MMILTAHDLKSGEVVYWSADGQWVPALRDAVRLEDEPAKAQLKLAEASETVVVHPYLVPIDANGAPIPREKVREGIRAKGPTIHPAFGKQAEGDA